MGHCLCSGRAIKFGRTSAGNARFRCLVCHKTFGTKKAVVSFTDFLEFAQLITGMVNRKKIISERKVSRPTLAKKFQPFFDHPLPPEAIWEITPPQVAQINDPWVYGVDGKWLKRQGVILIHRDVTHQENLFWSFHKSESAAALEVDLTKLSQLISHSSGNFPVAAVSDWKQAIVTAVATFFGPIPHQRCLSHVLRLAKKLLPKNSPIPATLHLREIALDLNRVRTSEEQTNWQGRLAKWKDLHNDLLKEKTLGQPGHQKKWWYTHGNLRRGYKLLTHDQDSLFVYLTDELIPKSNNSLEGINSQLNQKLGSHRGMPLSSQISFAFWHLTFGGEGNNLPKLRKLWGYWRKKFLQ